VPHGDIIPAGANSIWAAALLLIDPPEEVVGDDTWLMSLVSSMAVGSGS